ncbi:MAG: Crp/Fnr family transcriptional regulator [Treponema sp.]|nr:Crp/Fnr family transcriptional regulator [Treponema sp.]
MKRLFEVPQSNPLFDGIAFSDFERMFDCLSARKKLYQKGEIILLSGNSVNFVGLVISGSVQVIKNDEDGRVNILAELGASELFGETFACAGIDHSPVTVIASEKTEILLMNYRKIITICKSSCSFHAKLIENMLALIARKNLMLNQKIEILSKRTTREKLLCFFNLHRATAKKFTIPFNREELAQYICVDRSSMSAELGKMRDEGIIKFEKNEFEIL